MTIDSTVTHQRVHAVRSVEHFFLHCQFYADQKRVLIDSVSEIIGNEVQVYPEQYLCRIFLHDSESFNSVADKIILDKVNDKVHQRY